MRLLRRRDRHGRRQRPRLPGRVSRSTRRPGTATCARSCAGSRPSGAAHAALRDGRGRAGRAPRAWRPRYLRADDRDAFVIALNAGEGPARLDVDLPDLDGRTLEPVVPDGWDWAPGEPVRVIGGRASIELPCPRRAPAHRRPLARRRGAGPSSRPPEWGGPSQGNDRSNARNVGVSSGDVSDLPFELEASLVPRLRAAVDVEGKLVRALEALGPLAGRDVAFVDLPDGCLHDRLTAAGISWPPPAVDEPARPRRARRQPRRPGHPVVGVPRRRRGRPARGRSGAAARTGACWSSTTTAGTTSARCAIRSPPSTGSGAGGRARSSPTRTSRSASSTASGRSPTLDEARALLVDAFGDAGEAVGSAPQAAAAVLERRRVPPLAGRRRPRVRVGAGRRSRGLIRPCCYARADDPTRSRRPPPRAIRAGRAPRRAAIPAAPRPAPRSDPDHARSG